MANSRSESDRRLGAKSRESLLRNPVTPRPRLRGPGARGLAWPLQPRATLSGVRERCPPGEGAQSNASSRATLQKKRRALRVPDCLAPPSPHSQTTPGRGPRSSRRPNSSLCFLCDCLRIGWKSEGAGKGTREARSAELWADSSREGQGLRES